MKEFIGNVHNDDDLSYSSCVYARFLDKGAT